MMLVALAALFMISAPDETVLYSISFKNAVHHEAQITIQHERVPEGPLDIVMSRSSPGRYAIHNFAKNVYAMAAYDGKGEPLSVTQRTPHEWRVEGHDGSVRVEYTLFADRVDGTFAAIDETHAHLNMPATFAWARGFEDRPIRLEINKGRRSWKIATQLAPTDKKNVFAAPNLYYFLDSPVECSDHELLEWEVDWADPSSTIAMAVHHSGSEEETQVFFAMTKDVVSELAAVFGELPSFDFNRYVFIADYLDYANGDGMEHRNSTILTSTNGLEESTQRLLGTVSHEFIHCWNMERIRAKAIEPFDFDGTNMSEELWFGEGFTSYYDGLAIHRAGFTSVDAYAESLASSINALTNSPGRRIRSAADMSRMATFTDRATSADPLNFRNTFISYYTYGDGLALGLDLTLRTRFNTTLDALMQAMWKAHGKTERPYTQHDIQRELARVSGSDSFASDFFERYVMGRDMMDYDALCAEAGFMVRRANPGQVYLGADIRYDEGSAFVDGLPLIGTPLYEAGLDDGAEIIELDGAALTSEEELEILLDDLEPGDSLDVTFERRLETVSAKIKLIEDPTLEVVPYEHVGRTVTDEMRSLRQAWLGTKNTHGASPLQRTCDTCKRDYQRSESFCSVDGDELTWSLQE